MFGLSSIAVYLIAAAMIAVAAFSAGWKVESWRRDSADLDAQQAWEQRYKEQEKSARAKAAKLLSDNQKAQGELRTLRERIANAPETVEVACSEGVVIARPAWVVTPDDIRLWNDIVSQGWPDAGRSPAEAAVPASPAEPSREDKEGSPR